MMRLFLKKSILLLAALSLVLCALELSVRCMNQDTIYGVKDHFMMNHSGDVETLILGSSHTHNGIIPSHLNTPAYNLAITAQGLKLDAELLLGYIDSMHSLKCIVIDISYFSFRTYSFANRNSDTLYHYYIYMTPRIARDFRYYFALSNLRFFKVRLKDWRYFISNGKAPCCDSLGWSAAAYSYIGEDTAWNTVRVQTYDNDPRANQQNIDYLTQIINICEERSIRLIAVTAPTWHTYRDLIDRDQYRETQDIMREIQREHNIEYYNFLDDSRFELEDFYNADHLSAKGAAKFTKILADTLNL